LLLLLSIFGSSHSSFFHFAACSGKDGGEVVTASW
jgi:hypothetical protein